MPFFHKEIHQLLVEPLTVSQAMDRLTDVHEHATPDGDWRPFRTLRFDDEVARLSKDWFPRVIADDPPVESEIAGLFLALLEPVIDEEPVADCYVGGAKAFEIDTTWDWAVRPAYFPRLRYAASPILADIYRISYGKPDGLKNDALESLCLGFVAFAAKHILADADRSLIVDKHKVVGVAVGWDSGNPLYIGHLTHQGFQLRDAAEAIAGIEMQRKQFEEMFGEFDDDDSLS